MSAHSVNAHEEKLAVSGESVVAAKPDHKPKPPRAHHIALNLRDINQLFNSMDPSPFNEKDLDHDAEEFMVSWAHEFPQDEPIALVIHLAEHPAGLDPQPLVQEAVHHNFADRARLNRLEFKRLMKEGRRSLLIGLVFLSTCLLLSELLLLREAGGMWKIIRESLTIGGWVAMWRPLEIYLYEWWPLRRRGKIFQKLSRMPVEVRRPEGEKRV